MTRVTDLTFIGSPTFATSFLTVDTGMTKRLSYENLYNLLRTTITGADQNLSTTASIKFNNMDIVGTSTTTNLVVKGQAAIGGQVIVSIGPTLSISNSSTQLQSSINIRAYKDNFRALDTRKYPYINLEKSNGGSGGPVQTLANEVLGVMGVGGYDGYYFTNDKGFNTGGITFTSAERFQGNVSEITNQGTNFSISTYPPSIVAKETSYNPHVHMQQIWTGTGYNQINEFSIGSNLGNITPTLVRSNGLNQTGFNGSNIKFVNAAVNIIGVPSEDSTVDNDTLLDTNKIVFLGSRGNASIDRRKAILSGDKLGYIQFRGQTTSTATLVGSLGAQIVVRAVDNFTSTASGTKIILSSVNSGTNVESTRLDLFSREHVHYSDVHTFRTSSGQLLAKLTTSSFDVSVTATFLATGLSIRDNVTTSTTLIGNNATATITMVGYKSYMLSKIQTSVPTWVRIYTDSTSRTNDSTRSEFDDPNPGSGIIAEVITTSGSLTQLITPGVIGFNNDATPNRNIYLSLTNKSSVPAVIQVTLTLLQLEG